MDRCHAIKSDSSCSLLDLWIKWRINFIWVAQGEVLALSWAKFYAIPN